MIPGALSKSVGRWTPAGCLTLLERRFASSTNDKKVPKQSTTEAEPADSGEIPTPSLLKAASTKDVLLKNAQERLREKAAKEKILEEDVKDVLKLQETFRKGKSSADLDSG